MKSIQQTTPALRFKDEQGNHFTEWKSVALSDTKSSEKHSFTGGPFGSNLKREDYTKEGIRVIQLQNIGDGIFIDDHKIYTSIAKADQLKSCNIFPGEIIVSKMGDPVTRACLIPTNKDERYLMASDGIRLSVDSKKYDCKFVLDSINQSSFRRKAISHSTGSTRKRITLSDLRKLRIFVPQFKEQQKIASFLSSVDTKIEQLGKKKGLLKQYKKGMMQKLFSQENRFKDEQGKDYPDWERKKLGDLYEFKSTNSFPREKLNYIEGWVRNIHYGDIHTKYKARFTLNEETVPFVNSNIDVSNIREDLFCQEGDLVIADASEDYSEIGKTIELIALNNQRVLAGLHTLLARRISSDICTGYGSNMMSCSRVKLQIKRIAQGTKVLGISASRMKEIELPLPSENEQLKIANFLSAIDKKIELVAQQLEQTRTFKKGLLQQMFI